MISCCNIQVCSQLSTDCRVSSPPSLELRCFSYVLCVCVVQAPLAPERSEQAKLWRGKPLITNNACPPPPPNLCLLRAFRRHWQALLQVSHHLTSPHPICNVTIPIKCILNITLHNVHIILHNTSYDITSLFILLFIWHHPIQLHCNSNWHTTPNKQGCKFSRFLLKFRWMFLFNLKICFCIFERVCVCAVGLLIALL